MTLIAGACGPDAAARARLLRQADGPIEAQGGLAGAQFMARGDTTEEMLFRDKALLVVADARIDDRARLARELQLSGSLPATAELIALAWHRWGEKAPDALLGDYAFAVFDGRSERLWLIRDALGFRPLCFAGDRGSYRFCSLPSRLAGRAYRPENHPGPSRTTPLTWFAGVEQVQPGETVEIRTGGTTRRFWWQPSTIPDFAGGRQALPGEMQHRLDQAVGDRIGDARRVASHLSAGLDSTAVTATASALIGDGGEVVAITARPAPGHPLWCPPGRLADESVAAAAVAAALPGVRHVVVDAGSRRIAADLMAAADRFEQPLTNVANFGWFAASCEAAPDAGARRLLIGQMGNYGLSTNATRFWLPLLCDEGVRRFLAEWRCSGWRSGPLRELVQRLAGGDDISPGRTRLDLIRTIDPGLFLKGLERQGLTVVDPTADRRLLELSLTVPENLLVRNGDRRWLTRGILRGRVPDAVLDARARGYQAADWPSRLSREADVLADMLARAGQFDDSVATLRGLRDAPNAARLDRLAADLAVAAFLDATRRI